jgi:hypothetical protein
MLIRGLRRFLFIQTHETPNPNFLRFVPTGKPVLEMGTRDFASIRDAVHSPLALQLFCVEGISRVFLAQSYISVGKRDEASWEDLRAVVFDLITKHYASDKPMVEDTAPAVT